MRRILIDKRMMCIFCEEARLFLHFQDLYKQYFSTNKSLKILKSNKILIDVTDRNEMLGFIKTEHLRNNHRGINEVFNELKTKYFYPNLMVEISKIIDNNVYWPNTTEVRQRSHSMLLKCLSVKMILYTWTFGFPKGESLHDYN